MSFKKILFRFDDNKIEFSDDFNSTELLTLYYKNEIWFKAKNIALSLGYKKPRNAINRHVNNEDKITFFDINRGASFQGPYEIDSQTVFINKYGVFDLVNKSKLDSAKQFRRWVVDEAIPYALGQKQKQLINNDLIRERMENEIKKEEIEILKSIDCFDDRDRCYYKDYFLNRRNSNNKSIEYKKNKEIPISTRIEQNFKHLINGIPKKYMNGLYCSIGMKSIKKYRELYNKEPMKRSQYVDGALRPNISNYTEKDYEDFIDEIIMNQIPIYKKKKMK